MPPFIRYYTPPGSAVPSSVSRDINPGEYSWETVVCQAGRPILDAELNLIQDASGYNKALMAGKTLPSGFLRNQGSVPALNDYTFGLPPGVPLNSFLLPRLLAHVAGMPVVVDYTASATANTNVVTLPAATVAGGLPPDIKRTDFVFLEVWRAQVAPSPRAYGYIEFATGNTISDGDTITIDTTVLGGGPTVFTARAAPAAPFDFAIGVTAVATAANFAAEVNSLAVYVTAAPHGSSIVQITAASGGFVGNGVTLARVEVVPGSIVLSGATLLLGDDRPNKPTQDTVYRHGNVLADTTTNLPDALVDPDLNLESTQRVQVQYRLRTFTDPAGLTGVNPKTEPDGFSNSGVLAQGASGAPVAGYPFVPADGATVLLNSDAGAYGFVDNGLYIAGAGDVASAGALSTADGFVYAIPVCFVFRRNDATLTGGFDPAGGANGALALGHAGPYLNSHLETPGPVSINALASDRPDGAFHDVIVAGDILDLRRHVTLQGYDFASELKYQTQALLDQTNFTWQTDASDLGILAGGSGGVSVTPMICDEIARPTDPGAGIMGPTIRTFDHIARRFGSQSVVERVLFEIYPNAVTPPGITVTNSGTGWCEGDTIEIDFTLLEASSLTGWYVPSSATKVATNWPVTTRVTDVLPSYHDDGHSAVPVNQQVQWSMIAGMGTTTVTLTLDANPQAVDAWIGAVLVDVAAGLTGSGGRIFLELEITYPTGVGLRHTPIATVTPSAVSGYTPYDGGAVVQYDPSQRPAEMDATWVPQPRFRPPYREVMLEQRTSVGGAVLTDTLVTRDTQYVYTPKRIQTTTGLLANGGVPASATIGSSERKIQLAAPVAGQVPVPVAYYAQDPIADYGAVGYRLDVYYQRRPSSTAGVQAGVIPPSILPHGYTVEPLAVSNHLWTGQTGPGSVELAFPYAVPLDQIPSLGISEFYFAATATITVSDFNADTGALTLHSMVPMDATALLTLGDAARPPLVDNEFRAYYDFVNSGGYKSTVMAQPLSGSVRHKVFTTMLARVREDTSLLFRPGEVVLLVFSRFAQLDPDNKVVVADPSVGVPTSSVGIFRTKNLLLTPGS